MDRIDLGEYFFGDTGDVPWFVLWERVYDSVNDRLVKQPMALAADYNFVKFSARHQSNNGDFNDHTKDDIYSDLTIVASNKAFYAWGANDLSILGKWFGRLHFELISGKQFHSRRSFEFSCIKKTSGTFGNV